MSFVFFVITPLPRDLDDLGVSTYPTLKSQINRPTIDTSAPIPYNETT